MWWIYALLSAFFAALTAILAKLGIKGVDPDLATAIRTVVILLVTWSIVLARAAWRQLPLLTGSTWTFLVFSGLTTGLSWLCYFKALQLGTVSQVAPVDKLSIALTIGLAVLVLGEPLTLKTALGAGLMIGGTLVLIF
ncbi:EamA family transporter [Larkinella sp. C7]|uniref:EamA family transporter n=1 Tax=Larkinella sp. C7 TaxID=2576607 RepID=UPI0011111A9D|nr:EamA family transporter [Larkinella sp. C7]